MSLNQERLDELDRYYKPLQRLDALASWLFWCIAAVSVAVLFVPKPLNGWVLTAFVVLVVVRFVVTQYVRLHLLPNAENRRRSGLVSNALSEALIAEETSRYYNNPLQPSVQRLGASVLENAFFGKAICEQMATRERVKLIIYLVVYISALAFRHTSLGVLLVLTQTVFSADLVSRAINVEVLRVRNERIFVDLYHIFLNNAAAKKQGIAEILDLFSRHESAKAEAGIRMSTSIFRRLNPELSREWEKIQRKLQIASASEGDSVRSE